MGLGEGKSHRPTNFPYLRSAEDDAGADTPGGYCVTLRAEVALNVGDPAYMSTTADRSVNKTVVAGNFVGIVVGGRTLRNSVMQGDMEVGEQAAAVGQDVIVLILGKAKFLTTGAVARGALLHDNKVRATEAAAGAGAKILVLVGT